VGLGGAAWFDIRERRVPNVLNLALFVLGCLAAFLTGQWSGLATALGGAGVGFLLMALPFAFRIYRGGDAKLLIAAGAWLGPQLVTSMFVLGMVAGGAIAAFIWCFDPVERERGMRRLHLAWLLRSGSELLEVSDQAPATVPMALAFAGAGALVALGPETFGVIQ
jgi:prepilin peptidase CpaA